MSNSEKNIQTEIMLALSKMGCMVFRNNVGRGVMGPFKRQQDGTFVIPNGRVVDFGVGSAGGSDIIGLTPDGKFLAVEVKTATGRATPEQVNFIQRVRERGGVAGIVRSTDDLNCLLFPLKTTNQ